MSKVRELFEVLRGPIVAVTTPFKSDLSLDLDGMRRLVEYYCQKKAGPLIIGGSTGEFHALTMEERKKILEVSIDQAAGRLPIIAGCAHSGTQLVVELVRHASKAGAAGAMVTPPYYGFPGFQALYRHYEIIHDECDLGVLIYFSGGALHLVQDIIAEPAKLAKLAEIPNVAGFKDATGNFAFYRDASMMLKGKIAIIGSAGMSHYLFGRDFGSPGYLTGLGNIWPEYEIEFFAALESGRRERAVQIVKQYDRPYLDALTIAGVKNYFAMVKAIQGMAGLPGGPVRPPLLDWPADKLALLRQRMEQIGLLKGPVV